MLYFEVVRQRAGGGATVGDSATALSTPFHPQRAWLSCLFLVQTVMARLNDTEFPLTICYDSAAAITCCRLTQEILCRAEPDTHKLTCLTTVNGDTSEERNPVFRINVLGDRGSIWTFESIHMANIPRPHINRRVQKSLLAAGYDFLPSPSSVDKQSYLLLGAQNIAAFPTRLENEYLR